MTALQLLHVIRDVLQFMFGAYVAWYGWNMTRRKWDRTQGEYLAGMILGVLGLVIIIMLLGTR